MTRDVLIGIDAGTSLFKSIAFSLDGRQLASASLPNAYDTVAGGGVEQGMDRTWRDTAATLRALAPLVPDLAQRTAAIAVTGQGDGTWLIDADGRPVQPAWLWLDARAGALVEEIRGSDKVGKLYQRTGSGLNACQQGAHLAWMLRHRPEALDRAATGFHCKDWLYFNLTGERATDPSEGTFTFGNFRTRGYDSTVIETLGLGGHKRLLPPIVDGVTTTHSLSVAAAKETGLAAGTPVALGYVDVACTALGAGLYDRSADTGCTIVGSTGMHMRLARTAADVVLNDQSTGYTMVFPVPGCYAQMQSNMASTLNIDWLLDMAREVLSGAGVARTRNEMLDGLDGKVLARQPAQILFHPYISEAGERGPFVAPNARAQIAGLSSRHGYHDLMRAVFEGLAFAARDCYAAMGDIPEEVRLTGGAARSTAIREIFGAVLNTRVRTSAREEAGAAGAAMMAAVATGLFPDMDACVDQWVTPLLGEAEAPRADLAERYDVVFPAYLAARRSAGPVWQALAQSRGTAHA